MILSMALLASLAMMPSLKAQTASTESPENATLIQAAYTDLTTADHDYDGHRAKAAKALHKFAKKQGIDLPKAAKVHGEKKHMESQADSDAKLQDALAKLQQVKGGKHLKAAIEEIQTALKIK